MKRLFRFAGLVAGIGAVAYLLRDKMVRIPEDAAPPPHFKSPNGEARSPAKPARAAPADDLTDINGIGPVYAERLRQAGVGTFAELAAVDVSDTADRIDVRADQLADWVDQARQRLS